MNYKVTVQFLVKAHAHAMFQAQSDEGLVGDSQSMILTSWIFLLPSSEIKTHTHQLSAI